MDRDDMPSDRHKRDDYRPRLLDDDLDELMTGLPALAIEGPRGVGKTLTAERRAATVYRLDDADVWLLANSDSRQLLTGELPILIDEWQRLPQSFDRVRRAVDDGAPPAAFLLTGSATPTKLPVHSGAGRIIRLRLRPMTLVERRDESPSVSLDQLLKGGLPDVEGRTDMALGGYVEEILASGFPGIRGLPGPLRDAQLDGYIDNIVDRDFDELDHRVRKPRTLRRWMTAYAAATATSTSFEKIRRAARDDQGDTPARMTAQPYRDVLERLWIIDPVQPWLPTRNRLRRLSSPIKHNLADPALAARLLGADADVLLHPRPIGPDIPRDGPLLGALFESLVTLSVRVYAQRVKARLGHLRTWSGEHEVDLIVERGQSVVAIEVKLGVAPTDEDVRHLLWLKKQIGDELADMVIVTTGSQAYRRRDGVAVVPASLLGP